MKYGIEPEKAIANIGNGYRLKKLMEKAEKGENLTIGFLGGSITMGSGASLPETCYAYHVFEWWKKRFPKAVFTYVNAGIGGTSSQFGVARVHADLLSHQPDFVITEFSVNDENTPHFMETYEGMIRNIYAHETEPAIVIVNSVYYDTGMNAQEQHNKIGAAYQIPCISMKDSIFPKVAEGKLSSRTITRDDLHPNDEGHKLMADIITYFLEKIYDTIGIQETQVKMPAPITQNAYEHSVRYQNQSDCFVTKGFVADNTIQETITQFFRNGWTADKKDNRIIFEIDGTGIAVQYRKSIQKPTPIAIAIVDGAEENAVTLDGNFEEDWGDCLYLQTITEHTSRKKHTVEICIVETQEQDVVPFYLVSVIGSY